MTIYSIRLRCAVHIHMPRESCVGLVEFEVVVVKFSGNEFKIRVNESMYVCSLLTTERSQHLSHCMCQHATFTTGLLSDF